MITELDLVLHLGICLGNESAMEKIRIKLEVELSPGKILVYITQLIEEVIRTEESNSIQLLLASAKSVITRL